jgi:hypothetical protein
LVPEHDSDADIDSDVETPKRKRTRRTSKKCATKQVEVGANKEVYNRIECLHEDTNDGGDEGDEDMDSVTKSTEEENNTDESDWEVSDFASSDDSCDEWMP